MKSTGVGNLSRLVATATADASVQPFQREPGQLSEGQFGETYVAYMESDVPAQKGDRVIDQNNVNYDVVDVVLRETTPFTFKEVIMKKL